ncbi:hypothetical protein GCM10017566_43550 [Amycolatopsis bartoniae]|uniref:Uncharacterized protein n=1 Tax=Amycolatopsis bartoniae TaxID=941986 RepID=A0A8H9M6G4_9PSEU|nr:hypothetical protein GCM10017566_43550 [Amycolatopsis bartoniae]
MSESSCLRYQAPASTPSTRTDQKAVAGTARLSRADGGGVVAGASTADDDTVTPSVGLDQWRLPSVTAPGVGS